MPSRLNWCSEQQNLLKGLKEEQCIASWKKIAQILNEKFLDSSRSGKQCRDRYINYVRFNKQCPKIVGWTPEEDKILFQKFQQYGAKWVQISSQMSGRSQNNLKNRFYGAMRKIMRKIVKVEKEMKPKPKKSIKQRQLIKIFEQCRSSQQLDSCEQFIELSNNLYKKLLILAISQQQQINFDEVRNVITIIHKYNSLCTKSLLKKKLSSDQSLCQSTQKNSSVEAEHDPEVYQQKLEHSQKEEQKSDVALMESKDLPTVLQFQNYEQEISMIQWQNPFRSNQDFNKNYESLWEIDEIQPNNQYNFSNDFMLEKENYFY